MPPSQSPSFGRRLCLVEAQSPGTVTQRAPAWVCGHIVTSGALLSPPPSESWGRVLPQGTGGEKCPTQPATGLSASVADPGRAVFLVQPAAAGKGSSSPYVAAAAVPGISVFPPLLTRPHSAQPPRETSTRRSVWKGTLLAGSCPSPTPAPHFPTTRQRTGGRGFAEHGLAPALAPRASLGPRKAASVWGFHAVVGVPQGQSPSAPTLSSSRRVRADTSCPVCPWLCDSVAKGCSARQRWVTPVSPQTLTLPPPHTHTHSAPHLKGAHIAAPARALTGSHLRGAQHLPARCSRETRLPLQKPPECLG